MNRMELELDTLDSISLPGLPRGLRGAKEPSALLERTGAFELRLASTDKELRKAQRLRYKVFYEEGGAVADRGTQVLRRDICPFDAFCDHLLVIDREAVGRNGLRKPRIVGTYRLLRREAAERAGGFYSQGEFDLAPLLARHPHKRFVELGRSCVHPDYRTRRVIELLWRGLWLYIQRHGIDVMMGCASLPMLDVDAAALPVSFLAQQAAAKPEWRVAAVAGRKAAIRPLTLTSPALRRAFAALPPLLKAYVRVGASFSSEAVVDHQFKTIDVFTIMPIAEIEARYAAHFGAPIAIGMDAAV